MRGESEEIPYSFVDKMAEHHCMVERIDNQVAENAHFLLFMGLGNGVGGSVG